MQEHKLEFPASSSRNPGKDSDCLVPSHLGIEPFLETMTGARARARSQQQVTLLIPSLGAVGASGSPEEGSLVNNLCLLHTGHL